jgi:hypothetical protein
VILGLLALFFLAGQDTLAPTLAGASYLQGTRVTVAFLPADSGKARSVLEALDAASALPGLPPESPSGVHLILTPDEETFAQLAGGQAPDWGAAVALTTRSTILVPAFVSSRGGGWSDARVLRHEWAHIGLHQYLGGLRVPRWFSEGYAQWASGGWDWGEGWKLRLALARQEGGLESMAISWPRGEARARTAYLLSATTIEYLVVQSGPRALEVLFRRWKDVENFEEAFRGTFGVTTSQFEEDWRRYVRSRYGWLFVLSHSAVFWMVMSLVMLALVVVRKRVRLESMARLRAGEVPDEPSYWLEQDPSSDRFGPDAERSE